MTKETIAKMTLVFSWVFQILAAAILAMAAIGKITGAEMSVYIFTSLEMEPTGRIIIAMLESLAAIMLLTTNIPHLGAFLGFAVMIGASLAHISVLGIDVQGDGGQLVIRLSMVVIATIAIMYFHRTKLPFVGKYL